MKEELKVLYDTKTIEEIIAKLSGIKMFTDEIEIHNRVNDVIYLLKLSKKEEEFSIKEEVYERMKSVKYSNPDMHFKLYRLYRGLEDRTIDEEEACRIYRLYY